MKSLFPEMDQEIRDDRKAYRREKVQRARDWLKDKDLNWLINHLLENGPATEHVLMVEAMDEEYRMEDASKAGLDTIIALYALWRIGKLWRKRMGRHPCSGELSFLYGVRGVHKL